MHYTSTFTSVHTLPGRISVSVSPSCSQDWDCLKFKYLGSPLTTHTAHIPSCFLAQQLNWSDQGARKYSMLGHKEIIQNGKICFDMPDTNWLGFMSVQCITGPPRVIPTLHAVWCIILHGLSKYLIVVKPDNEKYLDLVTESNPELLAPCNQTIL